MTTKPFTPKPGSKVEAALALLFNAGTPVSCVDLCRRLGIKRKNVAGTLGAAIRHGAIRYVNMPDGLKGVELCSAGEESRAEQLARELQVSKAIPARRSRSMASTPPLVSSSQLHKPAKARRKPESKPVGTFRCGLMSDGILRLEGSSHDLMVNFLEDGDTTVIDVSFQALETLNRYMAIAKETGA